MSSHIASSFPTFGSSGRRLSLFVQLKPDYCLWSLTLSPSCCDYGDEDDNDDTDDGDVEDDGDDEDDAFLSSCLCLSGESMQQVEIG